MYAHVYASGVHDPIKGMSEHRIHCRWAQCRVTVTQHTNICSEKTLLYI